MTILEINRDNLKKIIEKLQSIDASYFNMSYYNGRLIENLKQKFEEVNICNTAGCIIGHCISLDTQLAIHIEQNHDFIYSTESVYYYWSEQFTGIKGNTWVWDWCFGASWFMKDNSIEGGINRIQAILDENYIDHSDWDWFKEYQSIKLPVKPVQIIWK